VRAGVVRAVALVRRLRYEHGRRRRWRLRGGHYIAVTASSPVVAVRTKTPPPNVTFEEEQKAAFESFPHEVATLGK